MSDSDSFSDNAFINDAISILEDLLDGKDFETVRRINYVVSKARGDELENMVNHFDKLFRQDFVEYADMLTRVFKNDPEYLEKEIFRLEEIFITERKEDDIHSKIERLICICNCAYLSINTSIKKYKKIYKKLYIQTKRRF